MSPALTAALLPPPLPRKCCACIVPACLPDKEQLLPPIPCSAAPDVEITISPDELEGLDPAAVRALYEAKLAEAGGGGAVGREDFSDLVAGHAAAQKKKIAQRAEARAAKKSKDKDFKF